MLFGDTFNGTTLSYSLHFRDVLAGDNLAAGQTSIANSVGSYDVAGPGAGPLIFTINAGNASDGVFVRAVAP